MSQVIVSLAQMNVRKGDPRANWAKAQQMAQQAKAQGGQMVVLPELWDVGFALKQAKEFASALNGGLFAQVGALSKQLGVFITGSMMEKRGLAIANTAPVISPDRGLLGAYRKTHLFPLMQEDVYLSAGEATLVVNAPWGVTAMAICYDLRFPELFRRYALEGAKMVIIPCQWPEPRLEHYRTLLRARAIENGIYIVACNRVGSDVDEETNAETHFFGHSSIIDPWGNIVFEAGSLEGVFTAPLDLTQVDRAQKAIPVLDNRRPDLYGNY
jgi:predicted amidohydrolase